MEAITFWTNARRRLIAKTLANLFLLFMGALATSESLLGLTGWRKALLAGVIVVIGALAVLVMPEADEGED